MKMMILLAMLAVGLVAAQKSPVITSDVRSAAFVEPAASFIQPVAMAPMASRTIVSEVKPMATVMQPIMSQPLYRTFKPLAAQMTLTTAGINQRNLAGYPYSAYTNGGYYPGGWSYGTNFPNGLPYTNIGSMVDNGQFFSNQPSLISSQISPAPVLATEVKPLVSSRFYQPALQASTYQYGSQLSYPTLATAENPLVVNQPIVTRSWNGGLQAACLNGIC